MLSIGEIIWFDGPISNEMMGLMYRCSHAYVAPYQSEGFNLPVLESMASGTPVLVTRGGSTDDFTTARFARYLTSRVQDRWLEDRKRFRNFQVSKKSLVKEMR